MGLARGVVVKPTTFEIPKLQLPFEQMYAQMQGMQQEKDMYDALKGMVPQHVEGDKELVQTALKEVDSLVKDVSESYATGKVSEAMRGIRQAKGALSEMWKPTGIFGGVEGFYKEYQKALEDVNEFTKGNTDPAYKYVYTKALRDVAEKGSQFDPMTGKRGSVAAPEMMKELDVLKELDGFLKDWKADTKTGIERRNGGYYWIGSTEKVPMNEVKAAMDNYMKSNKAQYALGIQAQYQAALAGEEGQQLMKESYKSEVKKNLADSKLNIAAVEKLLNGSVAEIKEAQEYLGVKADGIVGENTKSALADRKNKLSEQESVILKGLDNIDPVKLYQNRIEEDIQNTLINKYTYIKETGKMEWDRLWLQNQKLGAMKQMLLEFQKPPEIPLTGPKDAMGLNVPSPIEFLNAAKNNYKESTKGFVDNVHFKDIFENVNKRYGATVGYMNEAVSKGLKAAGVNGLDNLQTKEQIDVFKNAFASTLRTSSYGIKEGQKIGGKDGGLTFDKIADKFVQGGDNYRVEFNNRGRQLMRNYDEVTTHESIVQGIEDKIQSNPELKKEYENFTKSRLREDSQKAGLFTSWGLSNSFKFSSGAPKESMSEFLNYLKNTGSENYKNILGDAYVYGISSKAHTELNKQLEDLVGKDPSAYLDITALPPDVQKKILKKGKFIYDNPVKSAEFTSMNYSGTNEQMITFTLDDNYTFSIPATGVKDRAWIKNYHQVSAIYSMDPERGEITNPNSFYNAMDMRYDMDQVTSTAFQAPTVNNKIKNIKPNQAAKVGTTPFVDPNDGRESDIHVFVEKDKFGNSFLVTTMDDNLADAYEKGTVDSRYQGFDKRNIGNEDNISLDKTVAAIRDTKAAIQTPYEMPELLRKFTQVRMQSGNKEEAVRNVLFGFFGGGDDDYESGNNEN